MRKEELILKDFLGKFENKDIENKYLNLYSEYNESFKKIFAFLHQEFNFLFEFLNHKNKINKHYNAYESRQLIYLISSFEELSGELKETENEISINDTYKKSIDLCKNFLIGSGGSPIPDNFGPIPITKYDPIFSIENKKIIIPTFNQNNDLTLIGEGAFSIVKKYKDSHYNKPFAVKEAKKNLTERELERFKKEFEILKKLNFPYILEVYNYDNQKNRYTMEFCDLTLNEYITKNNQILGFINRKRIALQFLYGINYLHKMGILHRDLSFKNILVKAYDFNATIIKLSDFGLVKEKTSEFTKTDTEMKGTIIDPALESFKHYKTENDIYAIGFILQFIFTGKKHLKSSPDELFSIILKCTNSNLEKRYRHVSDIIEDIDKLIK